MKVIFISRFKWIVSIVIGLGLLIIFFLNIKGVIFGDKNVSIFTTMGERDKYQVRSELLIDALNKVGVCSPDEAAKVWADGLRMRSAAVQFSVMNAELKSEYATQLEESAPNWVTGMSSPWIDSCKIERSESIDDNHHLIELIFTTASSTGIDSEHKAVLTFIREGDFWRIFRISAEEGLYPYTRFQFSR